MQAAARHLLLADSAKEILLIFGIFTFIYGIHGFWNRKVVKAILVILHW